MAKIKFHIQSQTELVLDENAKIGDVIDLNEEQNIDTSIISSTISQMLDSEIEKKKVSWEKEQEIHTQQQTQNELAKKELEMQKEFNEKNLKISELQNKISNQENEKELEIKNTREKFEIQISGLNEQLSQAKDFKARQSTKEIGESLETYAKNEFDKIRMLAYPNAYFEKDNEVDSRGSKADFIFRDYDDDLEYVSIIFDMKTEMETTATKHKNEDFFKELDKDRQSKKTEYAVLVSTLEAENDFYNLGIVQVSNYEKMYVVRPQLMIQLIGLITNAAKNAISYKRELQDMRNQNVDVTHFEKNLNDFKEGFAKNYQSASTNFAKAIESIDRSIAQMESVKKSLTTSDNQLRLANNKLVDVDVKRLTKDSPSIKQKFDELNGEDNA